MSNPADLYIPFPHPPPLPSSSSGSSSGQGQGAKKVKNSLPAGAGVSNSGPPSLSRTSGVGRASSLTRGQDETLDGKEVGGEGDGDVKGDQRLVLQSATKWAEDRYWSVLPGGRTEREDKRGKVGLAGYLGYSVVAYTITPARPGVIPPNPFYPPHSQGQTQALTTTTTSTSSSSSVRSPSQLLALTTGESNGSVPFPEYDPRWARTDGGRGVRQVGRLHLIVDDSSVHGLTASQTPLLQTWDLISLQPLTPEAFSKACTELTRPGANQVGIITITTSGARLPFKGMKRSLVRAALRHGAVFEICYAAALGSRGDEKARQNFLTNAREAVRVIMAVSGGGGRDGVDRRGKGGGGIIFSSGDGSGVRGPADLINLATLLGMPANQAKEAVMDTPLKVILRAHARRAYKGVLSVPRMVMPATTPAVADETESTSKRKADERESASRSKKIKAV